jgi:hypothetical protein
MPQSKRLRVRSPAADRQRCGGSAVGTLPVLARANRDFVNRKLVLPSPVRGRAALAGHTLSVIGHGTWNRSGCGPAWRWRVKIDAIERKEHLNPSSLDARVGKAGGMSIDPAFGAQGDQGTVVGDLSGQGRIGRSSPRLRRGKQLPLTHDCILDQVWATERGDPFVESGRQDIDVHAHAHQCEPRYWRSHRDVLPMWSTTRRYGTLVRVGP